MRKWLAQVGVETLYVEPGSPWENGYVESFRSRLRDEFLALEQFESLAAARKLTAKRKDDYNHQDSGVTLTETFIAAGTEI